MRSRITQRLVIAASFTIVAGASYTAGSVRGTPVAHAAVAPGAALQTDGGSVCWHVATSQYECPDSNFRFIGALGPSGGMLTFAGANGRLRSVPLPPNVDAIFLSDGAAENFLLRYYAGTNNPLATRLREFLQAVRQRIR